MDNRREAIETAFNEAETEVEDVEAVAPEPVVEVSEVTEEAETQQVEEESPARDAQGKFSKKEKEAVAPEPEAAEVIERMSPKAYKKEIADKHWKDIPDEFKDELIRREKAVEEGFEGYKTQADLGKSVEAAIMPYMATINSFGATPDQAIKELFSVDHTLRHGGQQDKIQMMQRIFNDYGINPQDVFDAFNQQQPQIDPSLQPLYQELQSLKQQQQTTQQVQQSRDAQALNAEIERAKEGKPHFEDVRMEMAALIEAGRAEDLDAAYDMAIWARPDLRETLLQQERDKVQETARKTELARKQHAANLSVKGSSPASVGATQTTNRRDLIAQQFE